MLALHEVLTQNTCLECEMTVCTVYCLHLLCITFVQEQYEFIHEAVCDFAMSRDTYIDAREFDTVLARLKESSERGGDTTIEEQFQVSLIMRLGARKSGCRATI